MNQQPRIHLGYFEHRDCTVVAFRTRVGGLAFMRDENADLSPIATGFVGSSRRDELERKFSRVDDVFRSLE